MGQKRLADVAEEFDEAASACLQRGPQSFMRNRAAWRSVCEGQDGRRPAAVAFR